MPIKRIVLEKYNGLTTKERYTVYHSSGKTRVYNCYAASLPATVGKWLFRFLDEGYKGHVIIKEQYLKNSITKDTILYDRGCRECQKN